MFSLHIGANFFFGSSVKTFQLGCQNCVLFVQWIILVEKSLKLDFFWTLRENCEILNEKISAGLSKVISTCREECFGLRKKYDLFTPNRQNLAKNVYILRE